MIVNKVCQRYLINTIMNFYSWIIALEVSGPISSIDKEMIHKGTAFLDQKSTYHERHLCWNSWKAAYISHLLLPQLSCLNQHTFIISQFLWSGIWARLACLNPLLQSLIRLQSRRLRVGSHLKTYSGKDPPSISFDLWQDLVTSGMLDGLRASLSSWLLAGVCFLFFFCHVGLSSIASCFIKASKRGSQPSR